MPSIPSGSDWPTGNAGQQLQHLDDVYTAIAGNGVHRRTDPGRSIDDGQSKCLSPVEHQSTFTPGIRQWLVARPAWPDADDRSI